MAATAEGLSSAPESKVEHEDVTDACANAGDGLTQRGPTTNMQPMVHPPADRESVQGNAPPESSRGAQAGGTSDEGDGFEGDGRSGGEGRGS